MNEDVRRAIGKRIKEFRVSLGLEQEELAKLLSQRVKRASDLRRQAVSSWELGKTMPKGEIWYELGVLGMSLDYAVLGFRTVPVSQFGRVLTALPVRQITPAAEPSA